MRRIVQIASSVLTTGALASGALTAVALLAGAPANAVVVTFAQYAPVATGANLRWVRSGANGQFFTTATPTATASGAVQVNFSFLQPFLAGLGPLPANFSLNATTTATPALNLAGNLVQQNITGSFSFTYTGLSLLTVGQTSYATGSNLLTGTFTKGTIFGGTGSSAGYLSVATGAGSTLTFTSDFLDFSATTNHDIALALGSVSPVFAAVSAAPLRTFRASATGTFGSDPATLTAAIPEPASWALLFTGFALAGTAIRRRRAVVTA